MAVSLSSNTATLSTLLAAKGATTAAPGPSPGRVATASATSNTSDPSSVEISTTPGLQVADAREQAIAVADSASAAGASIADTLVQIRRAVTAAANPSVTPPQREALTSGFQSLITQLQTAVSSASFGGANLLDGSSAPEGLTYPANSNKAGDSNASVTLRGADLRPGGGVITVSATTDLSTPAAAQVALTAVDASTNAAQSALARLDSQAQQLTGVSAKADATDADGAALLALQVRQQLSSATTGLSAASQSILNLFKG